MVGCGGISEQWFRSLATIADAQIVGLVDISEANAEKRQAEFAPNALIANNLANILQKTKADVVFDCTVPEAHFEIVMTALEHNCHVLGEKPMADSLEQAQLMISKAQEKNKLYVVMQNWRYTHNIRRLKMFLASKPIGDLTSVHADFFIGAHFGGFRDNMAHVLIKDMAIHTFDAARFLTGETAKTVYALETNPKGSWYRQDASAHAVFEMTNNMVFSYRGSWCAEGFRTPWESAWRIVGTKGSILWDGDTDMRCEVVKKSSQGFLRDYDSLVIPDYPELKVQAERHSVVIQGFLRSLKDGSVPETVCTDNIKSLAMVYGAIESAEKSERVVL